MRFEIIKGSEDYIIFENGSILNCVTDRFLRINNGAGFYKSVRLRKDNKPKTHHLHRLLANAFIPKIDGKRYVNHKDGNKLNNELSNLEWCTHQENMKHAYDNGMLYQSEKNKRATLEAKFKPVINTENGIYYESIKEAASAYGLSSGILGRYLSGNRTNKTPLRLA